MIIAEEHMALFDWDLGLQDKRGRDSCSEAIVTYKLNDSGLSLFSFTN